MRLQETVPSPPPFFFRIRNGQASTGDADSANPAMLARPSENYARHVMRQGDRLWVVKSGQVVRWNLAKLTIVRANLAYPY